jgi:hypothetical protein
MLRVVVMALAAGYLWYLFDRTSMTSLRQLSTGELFGVLAAAFSFAIAAVVRLPGRKNRRSDKSGFFIE